MAFVVVCEFQRAVDWERLRGVALAHAEHLEFVPMVGEENGPRDALGICILKDRVTEPMWRSLASLIRLLRTAFGGEVFELYEGANVDDQGMPRLHSLMFG